MNAALSMFWGVKQRLGGLGLGALAVLAGAAAFYLLTVLPLQAQVVDLQADAARMRADAQQVRRVSARLPNGLEQLQMFYGAIPAISEAPALLNDIFGTAARAGVRLDASHYRITEHKGSRITRYEITLPVNGSYVQVRTFVAFVMTYVPSLSLDSLVVRKDKIGDGEVKAEIKMTLYLERT